MSTEQTNEQKPLKGADRLKQQRPKPVSDDALHGIASSLPVVPPSPGEPVSAAPVQKNPPQPRKAAPGLAGTLDDFTLPAAPREKAVRVNMTWLPSIRDRLDTFCTRLGNGWNRSNLTQYVMTEIMDRLEASEREKEG